MTLKSRLVAGIPEFLRPHWTKLEASPLGYRLAKGAFWAMAGAVLSRSLGLLSGIVVARFLGRTGMGEVGIIQSTVGMFSVFAGLGLGLTATKFVSEYRHTDSHRAGAIIGFSSMVSWVSATIMTVVMVCVAPWLAKHSLAAPHLAPLLQVGSLLLLFGGINGAQTGVLSGFEAFKTIARINWISGVATFLLTTGGVYWFGLAGAVWALVISLAINCALNFFAVRREASRAGVPITFTVRWQDLGILWTFSLPGMLAFMISGPVGWATSAMLVNKPGGYAEMGIYNATNSWFQSVAFLPTLLMQVLLPVLSGYAANDDHANTRRALQLTTFAVLAIVIPIVVVGSLCSRLIMGFYGPEFANGWPVLVFTFLAAGTLMVQAPLTQQLIGSGRMWTYFGLHIVWGTVFLGGTYLLLSHGAVGLAVSRTLAYVANGICVFAACKWLASPRCKLRP